MRCKRLIKYCCGIIFVISCAVVPSSSQGESKGNSRIWQDRRITDIRIQGFKLDYKDMGTALAYLRSADPTTPSQILIGFERIPCLPEERDEPISMDISIGTVGEIVSELVRLDPRYTYEIIGQRLINVYPKISNGSSEKLLNMMIHDFVINEHILVSDLVSRIGWYAPELRVYLKEKADERAEYLRRMGLPPPFSAGSNLSGNVKPPLIMMDLHDMTIRQILNYIISYSTLNYEAMPCKCTIGWKYEFFVDSNAVTGLGGYPKWSAF
jgi:hypothetical protein